MRGLGSSDVTVNVTNWKQGGPAGDVYWDQRLTFWCVDPPLNAVSGTVHDEVEGHFDKLKLSLLN